MSVVQIDGVDVYANLDGTMSVIINSDNIDKCMQVYEKNHFHGIAIEVIHGYKLQDIDFLSKYPNIKKLSISAGINDIDGIYFLKNLESVILRGDRKIDFSFFPLLKEMRAKWSPHFINIDMCRYLKSLALYNYSPKTKDCSFLSNIPWIEKLEIITSNIAELNGLEQFDRLNELQFHYCSKLQKLDCLEKSKETLTSLFVENCKSIENHEYVTMFSYLNILSFNDCGKIPSIRFITKMRSLKSFRFVNTDVIDGDISPCIGLSYAGFSNKKHFSHTMEQIKSLSNANH